MSNNCDLNYKVKTADSVVGAKRVIDDLSSQCDGATKVFTLTNDASSGTVQLFSTQFPGIYRPTVDFTESAANQITLTSEVGTPKTGQTLIAIYNV